MRLCWGKDEVCRCVNNCLMNLNRKKEREEFLCEFKEKQRTEFFFEVHKRDLEVEKNTISRLVLGSQKVRVTVG